MVWNAIFYQSSKFQLIFAALGEGGMTGVFSPFLLLNKAIFGCHWKQDFSEIVQSCQKN